MPASKTQATAVVLRRACYQCAYCRALSSEQPSNTATHTTCSCACAAQVYGRAVRIAVSLGGFIARVARDAALGQLEERSAVRAVELRKLLSGLGPSFVKIGQALSARPDLLPQVRVAGCR